MTLDDSASVRVSGQKLFPISLHVLTLTTLDIIVEMTRVFFLVGYESLPFKRKGIGL